MAVDTNEAGRRIDALFKGLEERPDIMKLYQGKHVIVSGVEGCMTGEKGYDARAFDTFETAMKFSEEGLLVRYIFIEKENFKWVQSWEELLNLS